MRATRLFIEYSHRTVSIGVLFVWFVNFCITDQVYCIDMANDISIKPVHISSDHFFISHFPETGLVIGDVIHCDGRFHTHHCNDENILQGFIFVDVFQFISDRNFLPSYFQNTIDFEKAKTFICSSVMKAKQWSLLFTETVILRL